MWKELQVEDHSHKVLKMKMQMSGPTERITEKFLYLLNFDKEE